MPSLRTLRQRMLGYLRQFVNGRQERPVVRASFPRLYDSQLETRRVLNGDPTLASQELLAILNAGAGANDGQADRFEVSRTSSPQGRQEIAVSINGQQVWQGTAPEFSHVKLQGSSDYDQFIIDPTLNFDGTVTIDGGVNRSGEPVDVLIVLPQSDRRITSVTMHDRTGSVQLQFDLNDSQWNGPTETQSATASGRAIWEVINVGQIYDYSRAAEHNLQLSRNDQWQLTSTTDSSGRALLQLSSAEQRYEFVAPADRLSIVTDSNDSSIQRIWLKDVDLSSIQRVHVGGDHTDSLIQVGWLNSSQRFDVISGSVQLTGSISSASNTHWDIQAGAIEQTGSVHLGSGSSLRLDAGATGTTIVRGSLAILGDGSHLGGSLIITGQTVRIDTGANLDVSGALGGGSILIGGDRAGANPNIRNATLTTIAAGARLNADATVSGNGGRIIVYAADRTTIGNAADLSARGGSLAGSGGFVETSGRRHLTIQGTPQLSAVSGRAGQWLIDPDAISIVTAVPGAPDPNITYITVADLLTLINAGGDVILQTTTNNPALGDIVIEAASRPRLASLLV